MLNIEEYYLTTGKLPKYVTPEEFALLLGCSAASVKRRIKMREYPAVYLKKKGERRRGLLVVDFEMMEEIANSLSIFDTPLESDKYVNNYPDRIVSYL